MAQTITLTAVDGSTVQFVDEVIGSGAMKDVYFSLDKSYVIGFFRTSQDANAKIVFKISQASIVTVYSTNRGRLLGETLCWPTNWSNGTANLVW